MNPTPRPNQKTGHAAAAPTRSNVDGAQHTAAPPPAGGSIVLVAGQRPLPEYELVGLLGRGGFGEVWKAKGPGGFDVALKFVHLGEAAGDVELRALELMKGIRHPNLLPLFGAWQRDGLLVVAMELADGTLLDRFRQARAQGSPGIPRDELLEHLRDAARGLDFLNDYRPAADGGGRPVGIQHKDVKPQNLLLVGGAVKVADFGLAKVLEHSVTAISGGLTPAYAAPEFFNGQATRWSDQYSLAVAYCELRGGKLPFEGSVLQIMAGHSLHPPDLSMLPDDERPAVARALAKKPEDRWPTCRAFAEALTDATRAAQTPTAPAPAPEPADRDARLRQEGEALLARHYREALERTGGKLTATDRDALAGMYREHGISIERAGVITRDVRARWREEQSGPQDRGGKPRPSSRRTPAPAGPPSAPGRRVPGLRALAWLPAVASRCRRVALQGLVGSIRALAWLPAVVSRCRRAAWQRLVGGGLPLTWLLAFALPLAGAAAIGLVLLAALYRSPTGVYPETSAASTAPDEASAVTAVIRDTGRSPQPEATVRSTSPVTPKEVPKPPNPPPQPRPEGTRPDPLDCTGPEGVTAAEVTKAQEAWAKYLGRKVEETVEITDGLKMTFVLVPPGKFRMGSPTDEKDRSGDETLHEVTLTEPFDLGKTEVTQTQYKALTGKDPSEFKGPDLPVETVSWDEARDCAEQLTKKLAGRHLYRLPTEAEWEYACRGGRPSSQPFGVGDGRAFSSREANCDGSYPYGGADKGPYLHAPCAVGSYAANAFGLFNMHGNVEEWCADRHGPYPQENSTNPTGPSEGTERIIRGGNWVDTPGGCRAANRSWGRPETRSNRVGFRLARSVSSGPSPKDKDGKPVGGGPDQGATPKQTGDRAEVARPSPLDCTGPEGVTAAEVKRAQEAWAKYLGRPVEEAVEIADGLKMTFVLVPPGKFHMGSPEDEKDRDDDETLHEVTLTEPFDLGKTEVTQAQYKALTGKDPSGFKGDDQPVETVSWDEARDCAEQLTKKRAGRHPYRLPTEAEWEYACRGGHPSSQPFGIGNGRALSSREANFDGDNPYGGAEKGPYLGLTCRVGSYPANVLGLYDMHGNVGEWCADWHGSYPPGDTSNPSGPPEGSYRVYRGSGWYFDARSCRAASRNWYEPGHRDRHLGFRLARSVPSGDK